MSSAWRSVALCLLAAAWAGVANSQNLLVNPDFDANLGAWSSSAAPGDGVVDWNAGGFPSGGSYIGVNTSATAAYSLYLVQCVPVTAGRQYRLHGYYRLDPNQPNGVASLQVNFYATGNCNSGILGSLNPGAQGGTGGDWLRLPHITGWAPAGALSARVYLGVQKSLAGGALGVAFDRIYFGPPKKGDLDGDGQTDLLHEKLAAPAHHEAWLMDGTASLSQKVVTPDSAGAEWRLVGVDQFVSSDGVNDLAFWNAVSGQVQFWQMGGPNGVTRSGAPIDLAGAQPLPLEWRVAATADFDHDGRPDLLWRNVTTQKLQVWTMDAFIKLGSLVPSPDQAVDGNWSVVAALDWNGDANTDLLWYNATTGKIVLWFMDASVVRITGQFTNPSSAGNNNWKVVAAGDYGRGFGGAANTTDIVWRNETSGNLVVWHMDLAGNRTAGVFTTPVGPASPLDWTVVGPR